MIETRLVEIVKLSIKKFVYSYSLDEEEYQLIKCIYLMNESMNVQSNDTKFIDTHVIINV